MAILADREPEPRSPLAHLREVADADPATLVGRFRTVDTIEEAHAVQAEVRRALAAADRRPAREAVTP